MLFSGTKQLVRIFSALCVLGGPAAHAQEAPAGNPRDALASFKPNYLDSVYGESLPSPCESVDFSKPKETKARLEKIRINHRTAAKQYPLFAKLVQAQDKELADILGAGANFCAMQAPLATEISKATGRAVNGQNRDCQVDASLVASYRILLLRLGQIEILLRDRLIALDGFSYDQHMFNTPAAIKSLSPADRAKLEPLINQERDQLWIQSIKAINEGGKGTATFFGSLMHQLERLQQKLKAMDFEINTQGAAAQERLAKCPAPK